MRYVIGIDEVGRGPLAGPVVLAAVALPHKARIQNKKLGRLQDSKKLTPQRRAAWAEYIRHHSKVSYMLARLYPRAIEKMNISRAANLAAYRACMGLIKKLGLDPLQCSIRLDGGLYPRSHKVTLISKTIVRGDEKISAIKLASILAKVQRDNFMKKMAKKYPGYGFEKHKGYATRKHYAALKKQGPSKIHRLTFLKKYAKVQAS